MSTMELFCWRSDPEHLMRDSSLRLYLIRSFALFVFMFLFSCRLPHPVLPPIHSASCCAHHHPCNLRLSPSDNGSAPRGGNQEKLDRDTRTAAESGFQRILVPQAALQQRMAESEEKEDERVGVTGTARVSSEKVTGGRWRGLLIKKLKRTQG